MTVYLIMRRSEIRSEILTMKYRLKYPITGRGLGLVVLANGNPAQHQADVTVHIIKVMFRG